MEMQGRPAAVSGVRVVEDKERLTAQAAPAWMLGGCRYVSLYYAAILGSCILFIASLASAIPAWQKDVITIEYDYLAAP